MLNSIQNQELTRMVNKLDVHTNSFVNYKVESISSDVKYDDGVFKLQTDAIRLVGVIKGKAIIHINYTVKYNFGISSDYEHTLYASIVTKDEDGDFVSNDIPKDVDSIDTLIRYLKTTFK